MDKACDFLQQDPLAKLLGSWSVGLDIRALILRIAISLVLAAIIGCERANKRHSAGIRTFILVSLSATMATICDMIIMTNTSFHIPILSAATIISVAMVSNSSILFSARSQVKGLTTAFALWALCIEGICIGTGAYTISLIYFLIIYLCLSTLPVLEIYLKNRSNHFEVHLELTEPSKLQDFITTIRRLGLIIDDIEYNQAYQGSGLSVYSIALTITKEELKKYKTHKEIIEALGTLDYVYHIEEMR